MEFDTGAFLEKYFWKIQILLQSDKNYGHFT